MVVRKLTCYADDCDLLLADIEKTIATYMGTKYAIVCSSARSAIRYSLLSLGVKSGHEVIISDLVPQELPITVFCTGAKPRLCDVDRQTCAMSFDSFKNALRTNTKSVIFSQLYGLPADAKPIKEAAENKDIQIIEDSSQAIGAIVNNKNFNKFLNVPLGAAILTDDEELSKKVTENKIKYEEKSQFTSICHRFMSSLRLNSKSIVQLVFLSDKYLYKLKNETFEKKYFSIINGWIKANPDVLALWKTDSLTEPIINQLVARADGRYWQRRKIERIEYELLKKELAYLDEYLQQRINAAANYEKYLTFKDYDKISISNNTAASYKKYPIVFHEKNRFLSCIKNLTNSGFRIDYRYRPLHLSPFIEDISNSNFENATHLSEHLLPLPITSNISLKKIKKIASIVNHNS